MATFFVALAADQRIAGFYMLAAASVPLVGVPEALQRKLPCYAEVPVICMGLLAVDAAYHGQGLGEVLLVNALRRAAPAEIGAVALFVDAKDERAAALYQHHGLMPL